MKKTLIALLALLLALTTGAALASGHRHGRHANAGHCYAAGNATSYCHYDGTCTHGGDACHFYADEDGDGICDNCSTHWSFEDGAWCGHSHVDADGDGICDNCPAHPQGADGAWYGHGYVDADGDGVCDRCPAQTGRGGGHHGCNR